MLHLIASAPPLLFSLQPDGMLCIPPPPTPSLRSWWKSFCHVTWLESSSRVQMRSTHTHAPPWQQLQLTAAAVVAAVAARPLLQLQWMRRTGPQSSTSRPLSLLQMFKLWQMQLGQQQTVCSSSRDRAVHRIGCHWSMQEQRHQQDWVRLLPQQQQCGG